MSDEIELEIVSTPTRRKRNTANQTKKSGNSIPSVEQILAEDPELTIDMLRDAAATLRRRNFNVMTHEQAMSELLSNKKLIEEFKAAQ